MADCPLPRVPWNIKKIRPEKVPGCQEVNKLPKLAHNQQCCGEGQNCFYFTCSKCSSLLALDTFNPNYRTEVEYLPAICNIERKGVFVENCKYDGEVKRMYFDYFARMPLKGVAINGWSSSDAARIFDNIKRTFQHIEKLKTCTDFEIDWLFFNGSSITVMEVKEKSEIGKCEKNFEKKMGQFYRDTKIMEHLQEALGCQTVPVNYIVACPNSPISEVRHESFMKNHRDSLGKFSHSESSDKIFFISQECMGKGTVYFFESKDGQFKEEAFINVIGNSECDWDSDYKHCASLVVISMLLIGSCRSIESPKTHQLTSFTPFQLTPNNKEKRDIQIRHGISPRDSFPECLILSKEQLEIINHDSDRVGISGEAGCGKTLVLLALLYSKAGKHLKDASLLKNKVLFLMQEGKTEFRKYVDGFVRDFCHSDRVAVLWLKEFQTFTREDASAEFDLILVDEFYLGQLEIVVQALEEIDCRCKCFMVIPPLSNAFYTLENGSEWSYFSLQKSYRCPVNIALRCAKLRRKATFDGADDDITGPMVTFVPPCIQYGIQVNNENSVQILPYEGDEIDGDKFPKKRAQEEKMLAVVTFTDKLKDAVPVEQYEVLRKQHDVLEFCTVEDCQDDRLSFTGVSFDTVTVIIIVNNQELDSYPEFFQLNHSRLLYQCISRSTDRVYVFYHKLNTSHFRALISNEGIDLVETCVLEKLRRKETVDSDQMELLEHFDEKLEALQIMLETKNFDTLKKHKEIVINKPYKYDEIHRERIEDVFFNFAPKDSYRSWSELLPVLKDTTFAKQNSNFITMYCRIGTEIPYRYDCNQLRKLLEPLQASFGRTIARISYDERPTMKLHIVVASICWGDWETFHENVSHGQELVTSALKDLLSMCNEVPEGSILARMKSKIFAFTLSDVKKTRLFNEYSALEADGRRMRHSADDIRKQLPSLFNPFGNADSENVYLRGLLIEAFEYIKNKPKSDKEKYNEIIGKELSSRSDEEKDMIFTVVRIGSERLPSETLHEIISFLKAL